MTGKMLRAVVFVATASIGSLASAAITFVDATTTNTYMAGDTPPTNTFAPTSEAARGNGDNLWAPRANAGLNAGGVAATGDVFESNGTAGSGTAGTEDSPT